MGLTRTTLDALAEAKSALDAKDRMEAISALCGARNALADCTERDILNSMILDLNRKPSTKVVARDIDALLTYATEKGA